MEINELTATVRRLVAENAIEEAINVLLREFNNGANGAILDEVILHSSSYVAIKKAIRLGTVEFKDANLAQSQVRLALLDLLREIEALPSLAPSRVAATAPGSKLNIRYSRWLDRYGWLLSIPSIVLFLIFPWLVCHRSVIENSPTGEVFNPKGNKVQPNMPERGALRRFDGLNRLTWFTIQKMTIRTDGKTYDLSQGNDVPSQGQCIELEKNSVIELDFQITLNVDFAGSGMLVPIGLSTTWNQNIIEISDGKDFAVLKEHGAFDLDYSEKIKLRGPNSPGKNYIVFLAGLVTTVQELFYFNAIQKPTAGDFWHIPLNNMDHVSQPLAGRLEHPFVFPNGGEMDASWPCISICIHTK